MVTTLNQLRAETAPEILAEADALYQELLLEYNLAKLREMVNKTQQEMADSLGIKQPTLAGMEKKGNDIKLSSLKRYVEAAGCRLNLDIELPDGTHCAFRLSER
ncbi:helix-turn-helix domain-containing protein [Pluralibacter gergoviae]|uniref:helix-turn-helix domain-containing protein n=1 Tax=Pluralibacter gergoviae TaxID=61647 RepID=UPI0004F63DF6|nr:helix-turn-helix domain-containing protein [Pluralibacter gergoviae]AIR00823.1 transcriptional regulator [Pluralibacter gergoviae]EKT9638786.1 XRE family transcriptional regulator [Pluralibacter gergoviae]EKW6618887.1 XRE family transcriptional regulator [Pluralibacter gergoviae]EMD1656721.1 XRE family transcriptional regulator [Pluralibacter gergoviae]MBK4117788.1 XRE family transcriptional regulator [Pluralibacter gergoviae]